MLLNLHKKSWMDGLQLTDYKEHSANNEKTIKVFTHNMLVGPGPTYMCASSTIQRAFQNMLNVCVVVGV